MCVVIAEGRVTRRRLRQPVSRLVPRALRMRRYMAERDVRGTTRGTEGRELAR